MATSGSVESALAHEGMVGVIGSSRSLDEERAALPTSDRLELVSVGVAKGLEFDHVVLLEPPDVVGRGAHSPKPSTVGLRHLYVALTRAVTRLTLVHRLPLPQELGEVTASRAAAS